MEVTALSDDGFPDYAVEQLTGNGITELNPPQESAIEAGLLTGESMLVASPTASGKTLIATMAITQLLANSDKSKALYLVPLRALGSEKYADYSEFYDGQPVDVGISIGDRDAADQWIENKDLIIMTVEKLDAILRHNPSWIKDVDLVVVDEIHLMDDQNRGPTLEVTLTRLRQLMEFQLLGLSATVNNAEEIADWLDCTLVKSEYRPVTLKQGVHWNDRITFYDEDVAVPDTPVENDSPFKTGTQKMAEEQAKETVEETAEELEITAKFKRAAQNILHDSLEQDKQAITFVNSRKSAESEAERSGKVANAFLSREEQNELNELADRIENVLGSPTSQCKRLAKCVRNGAAFHHAGLVSQQRGLIEEHFRSGLIRSIAATPTLAAGMSMPAFRIIIRDTQRYTDNGMQPIPVMEYQQMAGRAGRPEHHDEGQAIAVAKNSGDVNDIKERYILGDPEDVTSKLAVEPVLRMHALGLVATRFCETVEDLQDFFNATFYAHHYGDESGIRSKLLSVVENLEEYGFVTVENESRLRPTKVGKRVAELYIDPYTAHTLLEQMREAGERDGVADIAYLHMMCGTVEMKPRLRVRKNELADLEDNIGSVEDKLLEKPPKPWDEIAYEVFLESMKTALMLQSWIDEVEEDELMDQFNVTPGGIRAKVEHADWLLYACTELCTLKGWDEVRSDLSKLRTRMKHGIREELLALVRFKGVGRVRARALYERDITSTEDLRQVGFTKLKKAVGKRTAEKLKEQVGDDDHFDKENILHYFDE